MLKMNFLVALTDDVFCFPFTKNNNLIILCYACGIQYRQSKVVGGERGVLY